MAKKKTTKGIYDVKSDGTTVKKLFRSKNDRMIAGVFGGMGDYMKVDPTLLRIIGVILLIFTGVLPVLIAYIVLAIIIPENPTE